MHIVVLIKQVPEIALIKVNEAANEVETPQGPGVVNPFDEYAVEEALRLKERIGGTVSVVTVGDSKAESALRECLALGVDNAYLINDDIFVGSDSQAIGRILAAAITKIGDVDMVIGGKQAVDSDSSQVPAAVAAHLDQPQVLFVKKFDSVENGAVVAHRTTEDGYDVVETALPAVFSVVKEINEPRLPSLKGKMAAKKKQITAWTGADIGIDASAVGTNSRSTTTKVAPPPPRPQGEFIEGDSPEAIVDALFQKLRDDQVI